MRIGNLGFGSAHRWHHCSCHWYHRLRLLLCQENLLLRWKVDFEHKSRIGPKKCFRNAFNLTNFFLEINH